MRQSTSLESRSWHVGIIPDGNGRWAATRGLPRTAGHRAGVEAVRRVVAAAPRLGIGTLTIFAFSSDNWHRSPGEVRPLLHLIEGYLREETPGWVAGGVRASVIGRRDRLPVALRAAIQIAEDATASGSTSPSRAGSQREPSSSRAVSQRENPLHLRLAVDYSGRDAILRAACRMYTATEISPDAFARLLPGVSRSFGTDGQAAPDVDLVIRAGGEQRLSDFLLWECAYAELYFTDKLWPDFSAADLEAAMQDFHSRSRTFGRLPEAAAS
jgi:undecaprenyl diphosphate synthase